jgi:hypothetical protein
MVQVCVFRTDLHVVTSFLVTRMSHVHGSRCNVTVCLILMSCETYAECVPPLHNVWYTFCVFCTDLDVMMSVLVTRVSHVLGSHCDVTVCLLLMRHETYAKCAPNLHHTWFTFVFFVLTLTS